jgi:5-methylcytosine-specific restriction endonuclease McrA
MKTLLLDKVYRPISFIGFRKMVKLVCTDKVEIISEWKGVPFHDSNDYPAIIRLKGYVRRRPLVARFNFKGVFRRDGYRCQYTGVLLPPSKLTVDHVIPKSRGGTSCWENCVAASLDVNAKKADRTPDEAGLKLLRKPEIPSDYLALEYSLLQNVHKEWEGYFPNAIRVTNSSHILDELKFERE